MLFPDKKSALIRLSDCIKFGIRNCLNTTNELIKLYEKYEEPIRERRAIAKDVLKDRISTKEGEKKIQEMKDMPEEDSFEAVRLMGQLHSECLSVLLSCSIALESYINSLGYHILKEKDFLGLVRGGHEATAEVLVDAIEKMDTRSKWATLGKLNKGKSFDKSKKPYQDLINLVNFRNDIVHDKIADYSDDRPVKRYNKKLPDPVFGFLDLSHVIFAVDTYWGMITEIHSILGTEMKDFHRHYNLTPWFSNDFEKER